MPRTLIKEQRIFVLKQWWISGKTSQTVNTTFRNGFPGEEVLTRQTMSRLAKEFDETSSIEDAPRKMVDQLRSGQKKVGNLFLELFIRIHENFKGVHHMILISHAQAYTIL